MDPGAVRVIGNTGKEGKGENQFAQPRGICVDSRTKEVFIVDCNNHRIQVYHLNSLAYIRQIGKGVQGDSPGALNYAVGICLDDNNQIYVADTNNHRVVVFNRITGGHVRNISSQGTVPGCLYSPYGVCVDLYTNILYVADYDNHRIQTFDKETGEHIRVIGSGFGSGDGQMNQPIVVCIDYEMDTLLVADYSNNRVIVFDKETYAFICNIGNNEGANSLCGPRGLCLNKEANLLFVADRENHRVQVYDKSTYQYIRTIGEGPGTNPGQFHRPMELCVNVEEGVLLVVDGYNHRVQILELPELLPEKRRLRALAKSRAEAEVRGRTIPKPSLLAVSTPITGRDLLVRDSAGHWRLRFERLGPLFDVSLSASDLSALLSRIGIASFMSEDALSPLERDCVEAGSTAVSPCHTSSSSSDLALRRQGGMFLSILESLCSTNQEADANLEDTTSPPYMLAAPALFALHSLIDRGWTPTTMPECVVALLTTFLSNIRCGIAKEEETNKLQSAIIVLLRAAVTVSDPVRESVLHAVLAVLNKNPASTEALHTATTSAADVDSADILLSQMNLLAAILSPSQSTAPAGLLNRKKTPSKTVSRTTSRASFSSSTGFHPTSLPYTAHTTSVHERRKQCNQLRDDALEFLYGVTFMNSVNRDTAKGQSSEPRRTLRITLPVEGALPELAMSATAANTGTTTQVVNNIDMTSHDFAPSLATATSTVPINANTLPSGFSDLIKITYKIQKIRTKEKKCTLLEYAHSAAPSSTLAHCNESSPLQTDDGESLRSLQVKLFRSASNYFIELRQEEARIYRSTRGTGMQSSAHCHMRRTRGGRNIWRPSEPLAPGDLVDAQDKERCWFESIVQEITADGNVKVHFMGWGSKWDDIITPAELTARLAPLNTKTKNWRADLFSGGLIEIKCNDDPVNQKWMWGKITALNTEEAWVEVSYLFSNEPSVVKRAWLFGETICPVGMHTKDKSKAAAALLVKPLKKVEDIIRERSEVLIPDDEYMFFDSSDDLDETALDAELAYSTADSQEHPTQEQQLHSPHSAASSLLFPALVESPAVCELLELCRSNTNDALQSVHVVGLSVLECLIGELVQVLSSSVATAVTTTSSSSETEMDECQQLAGHLITHWARGPYRRLLVPYLTRPLTFQCGVRSRLLASRVLQHHNCSTPPTTVNTTSATTATTSSNIADHWQDCTSILQLFQTFSEHSSAYCSIIHRTCTTALPTTSITAVTSRITATIYRCGTMEIMNNLISCMIQNTTLRSQLFYIFDTKNRFKTENIQLRKCLSYLFKNASKIEILKVQNLIEGILIKTELSNLDFKPQCNKKGIIKITWAISIILKIIKLLRNIKSIISVEFMNIPNLKFAGERALRREFAELSSESVRVFAQCCAMVLDVSLCEREGGGQGVECTGSGGCAWQQGLDGVCEGWQQSQHGECEEGLEGVCMSPSQKEDCLSSTLDLVKLLMTEELLHYFQPAYESLLAARLLSQRYRTLQEERAVLDTLPVMPSAARMLQEASHSSTVNLDFSLYLMEKVDNEEIQYCPALEIVLEQRAVTVQVLCQHTWYKHCGREMYYNLMLPAPLRTIQAQFECFYQQKAQHNSSSSGLGARRLTWCRSVGVVTMQFTSRPGVSFELRVSEPQAAVLYLFNTNSIKSRTVADIAIGTNLSLEELRPVLESLCGGDDKRLLPLLQIQDRDQQGSVCMGSKVGLSEELRSPDLGDFVDHPPSPAAAGIVWDYSRIFPKKLQLADRNSVHDWRRELIDAAIVRVLKATAATAGTASMQQALKCGPSRIDRENKPNEILSAQELSEKVQAELKKRGCLRNSSCSNKEVLQRTDHLAALGYIDKVALSLPPSGAGGGGELALHNPAVSLVSIGYVYISAAPSALSTDPSVRVELREEVDGTKLFHTLQSILHQQHVCAPSALDIDRRGGSMGATEDHSSGIGKTNADFGETKSEASADEGSTPEKVQDTPIQQPASQAFSGHSTKDTIAMLALQRGIVSWVAQQQPSLKPLNLPTNRSASEHSDLMGPICSPATTTTPPRPSLRPRERLSGSFPIVRLNPSSSHMDTAPDVLKMSAARTESKSALDSPMAASFPQFPRHSPVVSAHTVSPHSAGISAVPFPLFPNNSASPCQETRADHVLTVLNARLYGVLGAIVSQLSKLVFQHSVGSAPAVLRPDLLAFGPPSIQSYLSEIHCAYALSASSRRTQDWSLLHKYMFFKLPVEMITALCLRFSTTLEADSLPTVAHDAAFWAANWNTMFALRSASETSSANKADESAGSFSNEDSKESTAAFDSTAQASQSFLSARSPAHNSNTERKSLAEFVSEALNRDQYSPEHTRFAGLNSALAAGDDLLPEELFPLFAASTARSRSGEASPSQNHHPHSASGSGGSGKRRMRGRSSRAHSVRGGLRGSYTEASSALHSTAAGMSKLRRSSSSEEGIKTNDAIRGISFAGDGDARPEDFNRLLMVHRDSERSLSDLYLGDPDGTAGLQSTFSFAGEASGSSVPSSRSSSRSNSHADFGVAQLMLSIEEQLRQTSAAPSAVTGYAKGTPPRSAAQSSARKSAAHPTLSAEIVYKPESNSQYMTPRSSSKVGGRVLSDSSSIIADNSVSGSSEQGCTSATSSLFQLLQQYFQSFFAIFTRLMGSSVTVCPVPTLDTLQLTELAIMLLQAASEKIVPKEELGRNAHCPARRLWFVIGTSCTLKDVFVSAFAELDSNKDGLLSVEDFGSAGRGSDALLPPRHPHMPSTGCLEWSGLQLDTEVQEHYVNNTAFMALSETRRRSGDLLELVEGAARVLSLPLHRIARLLSEHGWDASAVLNYFCEGDKHTVSDCNGQSFICLRDSRADQIARGVSSCHSVCDTCHCARSVETMYALRCRHFNCSECWERSVFRAAQSDCGTVCCAQCRTEPADQHRQGGEGVAGDDLVLHIASKQAQEQYFQGVWRKMTRLYEDQNSTAVGSDELLQLLLQSPRNRSAPLMSVSVDKAHSYGNTSQSVFSIQDRHPSLFLSGDTQLFADHSSGHSQEHVTDMPVRVATPAARLSALSARLTSASSGRTPRSPPPPSSAHPVRAAASTDIGVGVHASTGSSWASDRTEGNLTKYLLETRTLTLAKATEAERVLRSICSESQLQLHSDKLAVLDQYLRAVELVKHFEDHFAQHSVSIRTGREREAHEICEAVMGLLDLLIVTSVKVRTKWSTADGFTSHAAREFSHYLRQRMHGIVAMMRSPVLTNAVAGQKHREGRFFSLVAPSSVAHSMCVPYRDSGREEADRELFGIFTESLTPHTSDSKNANTSWVSSKLSGASVAGLAECRQLVERLHSSLAGGGQRTGLQLMQEVVAFADSGLQSALLASNICPVLLSHWCKYSDDASLSQATCTALEKMCFQSAPCAQALIALDIWNCIAVTLTTWHANADICIACAGLCTAILTSSEENKKASLGKIEQTALFTAMRTVLLVHEADFKVSQAVISAVVHCLDKGYTVDSSFMRADLCEVLVQQILHFAAFPGMKTQFVVAISRLASGNPYMQEALVDLNVLEYLMEIIADCDECEAGLLKLTCFAVGTLVARYHAAQTKFATQGGCRAICYALRTTQDLGTLTYILRAIAALSLQNAYVQDFFELESAVELMQTKKDELLSLAERTESFETKSKLNLLLLTCEYALDAVRVPAMRRNGISSSTGTVTAAGAAAVGNENFIELADSFRSSLADYARLVMASTDGRHRPQQQQQRSSEASPVGVGLAERATPNTASPLQQAPAAGSSRYDPHSNSNRGPL